MTHNFKAKNMQFRFEGKEQKGPFSQFFATFDFPDTRAAKCLLLCFQMFPSLSQLETLMQFHFGNSSTSIGVTRSRIFATGSPMPTKLYVHSYLYYGTVYERHWVCQSRTVHRKDKWETEKNRLSVAVKRKWKLLSVRGGLQKS